MEGSETVNETLLTGADGHTSSIDERTLAFTPAPIAASTVVKDWRRRKRVPNDNAGSFLHSKSVSPEEEDEDEGSSDDRSSLGLLPSQCLLDVETDLLRKENICLSRSILPLDTPEEMRSSNTNIKKTQLLDSGSSREHTGDSHEFLTTVKKCPQDPSTRGGRYVPQALFQSVVEENESVLDNTLEDKQETNVHSRNTEDRHQVTDSGMGQTNFTTIQGSKYSEVESGSLGRTEFYRSKQTENMLSSPTDSEHSLTTDNCKAVHESKKAPLKTPYSVENKSSTLTQSKQGSSRETTDFTGVLSRAGSARAYNTSQALGGRDDGLEEKTMIGQDQEDEADHTVHQIALEAEDLEELEEAFSDFEDGFSDEDIAQKEEGFEVKVAQKQMNPEREFEERQSWGREPASHVTCMDGPFKIPLPPRKVQTSVTPASEFENSMSTNNKSETFGTSDVFGNSIPFHETDSNTGWGPSIDYGNSLQMEEKSLNLKESDQEFQPGDKNWRNKPFIDIFPDDQRERKKSSAKDFDLFDERGGQTIMKDPTQQVTFTSFGGLGQDVANHSDFQQHLDLSAGDFPSSSHKKFEDDAPYTTHPLESVHGDHDDPFKASSNPFGDFGTDSNDEKFGFGDEDFMEDGGAAAAMLAEDEEQFNKDNLLVDEIFSTTLGSIRDGDQTFLNMTIGTYMKTKSGPVGSLSSDDKRPEFGMPVRSPPFTRCLVPILNPQEVSPATSPPTRTRESPIGESRSQKNSPLEADMSDRQFSFEKTKRSPMFDSPRADGVEKKNAAKNLSPAFDFRSQSSTETCHSISRPTGSKTKSPTTNDSFQTFIDKSHEKQPTLAMQRHEPSAAFSAMKGSKESLVGMQTPAFTHQGNEANYSSISVSKTMSISDIQDETVNSTSSELTFSSLHKLLERPDFSLTDPGTLILSEINRKVDEKKAAKQSMQKQLATQQPDPQHINKFSNSNAKTEEEGNQGVNDQQNVVPISRHDFEKVAVISEQGKAKNIPSNIRKSPHNFDRIKSVFHDPQPASNKSPPQREVNPQSSKAKSRIPRLAPKANGKQGSQQAQRNNNSNFTKEEDNDLTTASKKSHSVTSGGQSSKSKNETSETSVNQKSIRNYEHNMSPSNMTLTECSMVPEALTISSLVSVPAETMSNIRTEGFKEPELTLERHAYLPSRRQPDQPGNGSRQREILTERTYNSHLGSHSLSNTQQYQVGQSFPLHTKKPALGSDQSVDDENYTMESVTINSANSQGGETLLPASTTSTQLSSISISYPSYSREKKSQLSVVTKSKINTHPADYMRQLQNVTADSTAYGDESSVTSQFLSLIQDNTHSMLQHTEIHDEFASSTPLTGHIPNVQKFNSTQMTEHSILPVVTPKSVSNILEVPEVVHIEEVCCVLLSQQTNFAITNLMDRGVKCLLTIREVTFRGQMINVNHCPFELRRQVIFTPRSTQNVQVIFRPKDQGNFTAIIEIFAQNMTNAQENRIYTLALTASAEFPSLKISPKNDELDFGDLLWGSTDCRSIKIQNVGRATVPLRFSIFRKESSLCNFSFYPENPVDVSSISLTARPAAVGSVYSMSLPGMKDGEEVTTETISVYCRTKEPQNINHRYLDKAEKFQAVLALGVDMPIEDISPLSEVRLLVNVGMYKLHIDRSMLSISTAPGKTGQGTVKIINSGNIPMPVDISLEPWRDHFSISADHVVVPSGGNCPVSVTFTPQPTREGQDDNKVNLMLSNQISNYYVAVTGKIKMTQTKISGSTTALNFAGVNIGQSLKQKFTFIADNDAAVKVWIKNPGQAFKLLQQDGICMESVELKVVKGQQYTVWIIFSPLEVAAYSSDLMVQILYANRYVIPVSGYGGCSSVAVEKVSQADTGERLLDIGHMTPGMSIVRKLVVKNTGLRCCYVKAIFYDVARLEYPPYRATIMPSSLILSPNESKELLVMFNPSQKELDLCNPGRALVALIKLMYGDEVTRQLFLKDPGKHRKQLVSDYDIPLTFTQKEVVDAEMKNVNPPSDSYTLLKKSMSVIKIGLFGLPSDQQPSKPPAVIVPRVEGDTSSRSLSPQFKPATTHVSPNTRSGDRGKDDWTVTPAEIQLNVGEAPAKEFAQIINFSASDLQFSVDYDEGILVSPQKTIVKSKNTAMLEVGLDPAHFAKIGQSPWYGLIRLNCDQQMKYIKVYIMFVTSQQPQLSPKPTTVLTAKKSLSPPSTVITSALSDHPRSSTLAVDNPRLLQTGRMTSTISPSTTNRRSSSFTTAERDNQSVGRIQGSDMLIIPTTECGIDGNVIYTFMNISSEPLAWKIVPFAPPYVKHADNTHSVYRVNYDVFKLFPLTGVLQPDDMDRVAVQFCPQSKGSYNQAWSIHDTSDGQVSSHRFTIYAKAIPNQSLGSGSPDQNSMPQGLSQTLVPTSPRHSRSSSQHSDPGSALVSPRETTARDMTKLGRKKEEKSAVVSGTGFTLRPAASWVPASKPSDSREKRMKESMQETATDPACTKLQPQRDNISPRVTSSTVSPRSTSSKSSTSSKGPDAAGDNNSIRDEKSKPPKIRHLHLVQNIVEFPKLCTGESSVLKIYLKNPTNKDTQVVVESEPRPPFLIKHYDFKISKDKMVMFPVTFKPRHVDKFQDKIVFRELSTGNTLTAVLTAECVEKKRSDR